MYNRNGKCRCGNVRLSYSTSYCRICQNERNKEWRLANPKKWHLYQIKCKFGITPEEHAKLLIRQNGGCAICGIKKDPSKRFKNLAIDHDKTTGQIRGILCSYCNQAIGLFRHNTKLLKKAIQYLDKTDKPNNQ